MPLQLLDFLNLAIFYVYQPLWAHCQTRMRMQRAYRRQFVYSVESSSPSNPIAVLFSLAPPLAYCGRAGVMSRSPPRRLGVRSLPKQIHLLSSLAQVPTSSSSSSSNAPWGPAGNAPTVALDLLELLAAACPQMYY